MSAASYLPPRRRLWPRSLAGKAIVCFVGAIGSAILSWVIALLFTERRLAAAVARCEALGLSKSWEERIGPSIPDEENAAVALRDAGKKVVETLDTRLAALKQDPRYTDDGFDFAADHLFEDMEFHRLLEDADRLPSYRSRLPYIDDKRKQVESSHLLQRTQFIAKVEIRIARRLVDAGCAKEAVDRLLRWLRICRKWAAHEPGLVPAVFSMGSRHIVFGSLNDILREHPLPDESHAAVQKELQRHEDAPREASTALDGERYFQLHANETSSWGQKTALRPFANLDRAYIQEATANYIDQLQTPYAKAIDLLEPAHPLVNPFMDDRLFAAYYGHHQLPAVRRAAEIVVAKSRCLQVVNAMGRRRAFNGELNSLGLSQGSLIDPFDGQTLRVKRTSRGPIVYSVGPDLVDDGGTPPSNSLSGDFGYGPPEATK